MWQVWPHVTNMTKCDKCDHMWPYYGHLDIMDIWTSWTFGHFGHLDILDIWASWTFGHLGHNKRTRLKILWKFFLLNIWDIVGRRFLRTFPSSFEIKWEPLSQKQQQIMHIYSLKPQNLKFIIQGSQKREVKGCHISEKYGKISKKLWLVNLHCNRELLE